MGVGVAEGTETIVVFLAGSIPQRELDVLSIHLDIGDVVLEHGRDVNLRGRAGSGGREMAGSAPGTGRLRQDATSAGGGRPCVRGWTESGLTSGNVPLEKTIKRQVCGEGASHV